MSFMDDLGLREDEKLIQAWVNTYGNANAMPIENYLENWYEAKKRYLLDIFKSQLILRFPNICVNKVREELEDDIESFKDDNRFLTLASKLDFLYYNELYLPLYTRLIKDNAPFVDNAFHVRQGGVTEFAINYNGKTLVLHEGQKIFKAIEQVCKLFDIYNYQDDLKEARLAYSRVLNDKKIKGTLCLSIHPLDYMTMSDNDYGWQSCMNWRLGGCYHAGTIEMMNSPSVIVAYIEGTRDWYPVPTPNKKWSNKKWRELFIIDNQFIAGIKGYPFSNSVLEEKIIDLIQNMIGKKFNKPVRYMDAAEMVCFNTNLMYNDIAANADCLIATSPTLHSPINFNYSGVGTCLVCGGLLDDEEEVSCTECQGYVRCTCCEEKINESDAFYYGGYYYCPECFYENFHICDHCGDTIRYDYSVEIKTTEGSSIIVCEDCLKTLLQAHGDKLIKMSPQHYEFTGDNLFFD